MVPARSPRRLIPPVDDQALDLVEGRRVPRVRRVLAGSNAPGHDRIDGEDAWALHHPTTWHGGEVLECAAGSATVPGSPKLDVQRVEAGSRAGWGPGGIVQRLLKL